VQTEVAASSLERLGIEFSALASGVRNGNGISLAADC
jgi:hypothetical protein